MTMFKKMTSVLLSVVMVACMLAVSASASPIEKEKETATIVVNNKTYSEEFGLFYSSNNGKSERHHTYYKIVIKKDGKVSVNIKASDLSGMLYYTMWNEKGMDIRRYLSKEAKPGEIDEYGVLCDKNKNKAEATIDYYLEKGIYYLGLYTDYSYGRCKYLKKTNLNETCDISVKVALSSSETEQSAKISELYIKLAKGSKLSLGTVLEGSSKSNVSWSSSKSSVASVSKSGTITAKKAGTAVITAKCGNSTKKIKIKVT